MGSQIQDLRRFEELGGFGLRERSVVGEGVRKREEEEAPELVEYRSRCEQTCIMAGQVPLSYRPPSPPAFIGFSPYKIRSS
jgi:hypothetical protein